MRACTRDSQLTATRVSGCNGNVCVSRMSAPETDAIDDTHRVRVRLQDRVTDLVNQSVSLSVS